MVACSTTGYELNLSKLYTNLALNTDYEISYEPEVFPGLCIKTEIGSSNIYRNGKHLLLGTKDMNGLNNLDSLISTILESC